MVEKKSSMRAGDARRITPWMANQFGDFQPRNVIKLSAPTGPNHQWIVSSVATCSVMYVVIQVNGTPTK